MPVYFSLLSIVFGEKRPTRMYSINMYTACACTLPWTETPTPRHLDRDPPPAHLDGASPEQRTPGQRPPRQRHPWTGVKTLPFTKLRLRAVKICWCTSGNRRSDLCICIYCKLTGEYPCRSNYAAL